MNEQFSRQILLEQIGKQGQEKINFTTVAIIGVGALGTVAAELLVRAGVKEILLVDRDVVETSNLQRQTLFNLNDVDKSKAVVAAEKLKLVNNELKVEVAAINLSSKNIDILQNYELIIDCTDNLQTRFLINDYCKKNNKKWIYGSAIKTSGYAMAIMPEGPCLNCFLQQASLDTCNTVGVLNTITNSIAALQVTLALKLILGKVEIGELHYYDIWQNNNRKIKIKQNENCSTCQGNYNYLEKKDEVELIKFCSSGRYQISGEIIDLNELQQKLEKIDTVKNDGEVLYFKEIILFKDGRALIKADSEQQAAGIYSKWIGN